MKGSKSRSLHMTSATKIESNASSIYESYSVAMEYMLAAGKIDRNDDSDIRDESYREMQSMLCGGSSITKSFSYEENGKSGNVNYWACNPRI